MSSINSLNLSVLVVRNSMTLGQIKLIARCLAQASTDVAFVMSLEKEEKEEVESLIAMFNDPNLEATCKAEAGKFDKTQHGFCI